MYYSNLLLFLIVHRMSHAWHYSWTAVLNLLTYLFLIYVDNCYHIIFWWFIQFYLAVIVDSSGCAYSIYGDMRYIVYRWEFSYLDYPLEVSISWIYLLSPYNWFCHICLSYYLMPYVRGMLMTWFLIHAFDSDLSIHMWLSMHATWHSLLVGEFLTPLDPHIQNPKPGICLFSQMLIRCAAEAWIIGRSSGALSSQAPMLISRVFLL